MAGCPIPQGSKSDALSGYVVYKESGRGAVLAKLAHGRQFMLGYAVNHAYQPDGLINFLERGDCLEKLAGSDTLVVDRDGDYFVFVLGQTLYKTEK